MVDPDALQVSLVQTLESSQLTVVGVVLHAPAPLQKNLLPVRPEQLAVPHAVEVDANVQLAVQQDPAAPLFAPRSHCSVPSTEPFPHTWLPAGVGASARRTTASPDACEKETVAAPVAPAVACVLVPR